MESGSHHVKAWLAWAIAAVSPLWARAKHAGIRTGGVVLGAVRSVRPRHVFIGTAVFALLLVAVIGYSVATLPLNGGLQVEPTPSALVIEADNGTTFATRGVFKGTKLGAADVPEHLKQAIIAIEDRRFYDHIGIDPKGIVRAAWRNSCRPNRTCVARSRRLSCRSG
jgi:penicillin-binding protein 1A